MADEYIDKVEVGAKIQMMYIRREMDYGGENDFCRGMRKALRVIDNMPAANVQPVKHGYWIKQPEKFQIHEDVINSNYLYSCSCCNASDLHSERANNDGEVKFCWRCGARMDLKYGEQNEV
jgi:hypothetical protein